MRIRYKNYIFNTMRIYKNPSNDTIIADNTWQYETGEDTDEIMNKLLTKGYSDLSNYTRKFIKSPNKIL